MALSTRKQQRKKSNKHKQNRKAKKHEGKVSEVESQLHPHDNDVILEVGRIGFLSLPAEIRNQIYQLIAYNPNPISLRHIARDFPFSQFNRQVRQESIPFYLSMNTFDFDSTQDHELWETEVAAEQPFSNYVETLRFKIPWWWWSPVGLNFIVDCWLGIRIALTPDRSGIKFLQENDEYRNCGTRVDSETIKLMEQAYRLSDHDLMGYSHLTNLVDVIEDIALQRLDARKAHGDKSLGLDFSKKTGSHSPADWISLTHGSSSG